jgi:vacuolar-type H+-ATPase subunit F/Vma7
VQAIEAAFQEFTERKDIAILLINQHVRCREISISQHTALILAL